MGQVLVCRQEKGYELRHAADRDRADLQQVTPEDARGIAQFTEDGKFRPLKSAPTLRAGWRISTSSDAELGSALDRLYPGAIADLYATLQHPPPVTGYRDFTKRQSGMYRITTFLSDAEAAAVVRKCCAPEFCLKRRFWDASGHAPEAVERKSVIPCLEPCAILLEFARKVVRAMQREKAAVEAVLGELQPTTSVAEE